MSKVYIVDAKRSPIGKFLGTLSSVSPSELAAQVIKKVIKDNKIDVAKIDEVILGNVLSAGHGQNIARQASMKAGIPEAVPAYLLNMVCGSGMKSVMTAYNNIKAKSADLMLVGGVEVMSQTAFTVSHKVRSGIKMGSSNLEDTIISDGLTDAFHHYHMGITAENIAEKLQITREDQDKVAIQSQERAIQANDSGRFESEIVAIEVKDRKKNTILFTKDEYPNYTTTLEKLASLKPAFKQNGTVTAGNASGINDGAAILLIASEEAVEQYGLTPMAEIVAIGQGGVDPEIMGLGPVKAIENVLAKTDLKLEDMELMELNEAFAAQALGVMHELKRIYQLSDEWLQSRVNVNGGAIALGHPLGASGARIMTTLLHEMKKQDVQFGLASLCIGGGMGTAVIVKSV
ncbi:acetyl-CoA C-acetyltransferase [Brevibacillus daliensis]|uniref:acetyl-CoA C-acetyltransferase n=1 Tax=Brevibacillus daliensis TaxID=2892995 RepID=UPI001E5C50ED|nr:acetyl-CoA C-acetyltransferase [Brevibacillus daliensis]